MLRVTLRAMRVFLAISSEFRGREGGRPKSAPGAVALSGDRSAPSVCAAPAELRQGPVGEAGPAEVVRSRTEAGGAGSPMQCRPCLFPCAPGALPPREARRVEVEAGPAEVARSRTEAGGAGSP